MIRQPRLRSVLGLVAGAGLAVAAAAPVTASELGFTDWRDQRFQLFNRVDFGKGASALSIRAESAASMIYRVLPPALRDARTASWNWTVDSSVPATALNQRGGDDRNIALYFAFLPPEVAAGLGSESSLRALMNDSRGRVLVYVHGGNAARGTMLRTPYLGDRGMVVIARPAGTGSSAESVDLAADYARAFGGSPGSLVAVAVSADSDDTGSLVDARLSALTLR